MINLAMALRNLCILAAVGLLATAPTASGQDWPQWRGPDRDGAVQSFAEPTAWPDALTQRFEIEVGLGHSTPILVADRIYLYTRQDEDEVMMALDAESGDLIWRTTHPTPFVVTPAAAGHGKGPKSTPTYADGRLFTLGMSGIVTAFDAATGRQLWQRPGDSVQPLFHTAMSPVVDVDVMVLHVGGHNDGALTAFDVASGAVRWQWDGDGPAYGSPMVADFEGVRQVVVFTQENFVGVSLETGDLLWRRPFVTRSTTTSQTPIIYKDSVIQAGRGNGIARFRVLREGDAWTTDDLWRTDDVSLHMANGVVIGEVLYGLSHLNSGQYFGLDLETGQVLWTSDPRQARNAAIVRAGETIFSLEEDAELVILSSSRSAFTVRARYEVANSATWAQPTVSGNRIFVKDINHLTLWTVD